MLVMYSNTDGRVLNVGERPFANEAQLSNFSLVTIPDSTPLPINPFDYRYVNGSFINDPLPPSQVEQDKATARDIPTILAQIDAYQTRITQGRTALAAATTVAQLKPIIDGMLVLQNDELSLFRLIVKVLGNTV